MQITKQIAEFVAQAELSKSPPEVIPAAKRAIMDCIGVALAGSKQPAGQITAEFVRQEGGNSVATVIKAGFKTSASGAALANGTMAHALDYDDMDQAGPGHKTGVLVPSILAVGEQLRASGKDALEAYVVGFEVVSKIGGIMGRKHWNEGWHSTSTVGTLGSAVAASKLLKLDSQKVAMALAIAASHASGLKQQFGTMMKPFHSGMAARSGVVAAMMASRGFVGDESILEAPMGYFRVLGRKEEAEFEGMPQTLGSPWNILSPGIHFKPHACGGANHRAIDAILRLARSQYISPEEVESIEVRVPSHVPEKECIHHHPGTALEGKFSQEFTISIALLEGKVGLAQFTDEKVQAPRTQQLISKVRVIGHEATESDPDRLIVTLKDGRKYIEPLIDPLGSSTNPMSDDELIGKYTDCARLVLSEADIRRSLELIQNLEQLADIRQLAELLA